ncbi:MAG: hypothetical protein EOP52_06255 [Sphingobacteriales bacterium]|nr:MAG: hypothetical protein EOP52_06255 [Sphingobacteriales bacterium]
MRLLLSVVAFFIPIFCFSQDKKINTTKGQPELSISYDMGWYEALMNGNIMGAIFYDDFSFHDQSKEERIPYSPYTPYLKEASNKYWLLRTNSSDRPYESGVYNNKMEIRFSGLGEGWASLLHNPMSLSNNAFDIRLLIDKSDKSVFSGLFIGSRNKNDGIHITLTNWSMDEGFNGLGYDYYDDGIVKKSETIKDVKLYSNLDNEIRIKKEGKDMTVYVNGMTAYQADIADLKDYSTIALLASGREDKNVAVFKSIYINIMEDVSTFINKSNQNTVKIKKVGSVYSIPVSLNDVLKIDFIFDSGASDVSISPDIALTLLKTGTIKKEDWLEGTFYKFADGSVAKSKRFKLRSVKIGNKVLKNITCSISNSIDAPMLLGQSVLSRFGRYTFDNNRQVLVLE